MFRSLPFQENRFIIKYKLDKHNSVSASELELEITK